MGWEGGLQRQEMGWGGGGCCKGCVILVIWRLLVRALESRVASRGEERRGGVVGGISGGGGRTKGGGGGESRSKWERFSVGRAFAFLFLYWHVRKTSSDTLTHQPHPHRHVCKAIHLFPSTGSAPPPKKSKTKSHAINTLNKYQQVINQASTLHSTLSITPRLK